MEFIYNPNSHFDLMMVVGIIMAFIAIRMIGRNWSQDAFFGKSMSGQINSLYSVNVEKLGIFLALIVLSYMSETRLYAAMIASLACAFSKTISNFISKEYQA